MTLETFKKELLDTVQGNILPYWIEKMADPRGGFYGRRDGNDNLDPDAPKGAVLNARILWSFSAAYRALGCPEYLEMATRAKREVIDRFVDPAHGGVYWSLNADGSVLDPKKQMYAIGFAIYGLSEYARATGDDEALRAAIGLCSDIEAHGRDREHGGYFEALTRDWRPIGDMRLSDRDMNTAKSMNTHLHIIEPYANLLRVWPDAGLKQAVRDLLLVFFDRIAVPGRRGHLGLFFDADWRPADQGISYGHDIEASWLLLEAAQALGDADMLARAKAETARIAEAALEGRCFDGSMVYERHANGRYDNDKHWWVQAETVIGQAWLARYHGRPEMLEKAMQTWAYIRDNLVDRQGGEWIWSMRGAEPNRADDKAGFWKCPYHNTRMCLELLSLLPRMTNDE